MQKIRKIVRANSEKSALLTDKRTDGHEFIGPFPLKKAGDQKDQGKTLCATSQTLLKIKNPQKSHILKFLQS